MNPTDPIIDIKGLIRRYGRHDAVNGLNLKVGPGRCHGFFGRNGAGKTTTMKCLLNLLRPTAGTVRVFGLDPQRDEVAIKSRVAYVPDTVSFYPWMTVRETLKYQASFRRTWNEDIEKDLLSRFGLRPSQNASSMSRGQKTQLALVSAICPEPDLLLLDEPTSGLDPIVRREFIETVIGAYQSTDPSRRTVFVSTHLIAEFEGLIDSFTIIEEGRDLLTMEADEARTAFCRITARFPQVPAPIQIPGALSVTQRGREVQVLASGNHAGVSEALRRHHPEDVRTETLSLEEVFVAAQFIGKAAR